MFLARLLLLLALSAPIASAQYIAGRLNFNGAAPAQQRALEDTIKLHPGQPFSAADLQAAAQRLSDTGAFDDVQVTLLGQYKSIAVNFTLKPLPASAQLFVGFENFFWFTPAELEAGLRERVPLFGPTLPEAGNLIDAVQAALEDMLRQRSIPARVSHDVSEPSAERQARVVSFGVESPRIIVATIHLAGVSPEFASDLRTRSTRVAGTLLSNGIAHRSTDERLLLPYLNAGYIYAQVADRTLTAIASAPDRITLDLSGTIVPGPRLTVGTVTWAGSPQLSTAAFATASPLKAGKPASLIALEKTTELVAAPYRQQGYADVVVNAKPTIDSTANQINYTLTVEPGEQYRIRSIKPVGFTAEQQADFDREFKMKAGDLFDPDYILHFFGENSQLASFKRDTATYRAERDAAAHLVDVTISLAHAVVEVR